VAALQTLAVINLQQDILLHHRSLHTSLSKLIPEPCPHHLPLMMILMTIYRFEKTGLTF
jgi:hypothetical protein